MATSTVVPVAISALPADGQSVEHDGKLYLSKQEGRAFILIPPGTQTAVDPLRKAKAKAKKAGEATAMIPQTVFYNPIQQFNRDLSVLAIKAFGEDYLERKRRANVRNKGRIEKRLEKNRERRIKKRKLNESRDGLEGVEGDEDGDGESAAKVSRSDDGVSGQIGHTSVLLQSQKVSAAPEDAQILIDTSQANGDNAVSVPGDMSNAESKAHPEKPGFRFRILDALSASGLRALRYATEIPFATSIVANDFSPNAINSMKLNIEHNKLSHLIKPNTGDAIGHMYSVAYPPPYAHGPNHVTQRYDVIDLDPYGTAVPFIDAALQALQDGGLLCVTCTDSGVFASTGYSEKTYSLYGGLPIKGNHMHEGGLRLIIHSVASAAARYGLAIEPLLSLSIDFYARIFVRVRKSAADVKFLSGKTMLVFGCDAGCGAWNTQMLGRNVRQPGKNGTPDWFKHSIAQGPSADRLCEHCASKTHAAGPMWAGPLHNAAFVEKMLADLQDVDPGVYQTKDRVEGMLSTALEELLVNDEVVRYEPPSAPPVQDGAASNQTPSTTATATATTVARDMIPTIPPETIDPHPFFINASTLSKVIHCVAPSDSALKGALRHAGYRATRSHCQPGSIKTDAPWPVLWHVMREWARQKHPIREGKLKDGSPGWTIMQKAATAGGVGASDAYAAAVHEGEGVDGGADTEAIAHGDAGNVGGGVAGVQNGEAEVKAVDAKVDGKEKGRRPEKGLPSVVIFDEALGRDKLSKKLVRYQQNPRENWGPMTKAKGS